MSGPTVAVLVVAAVVTSTISGILGMAGGAALLAVMTTLLPAGDVVPLHGAVQLGSNTTRAFAFLRHVDRRILWRFAPLVTIGAFAAARLWSGVRLPWFKPMIGAFVIGLLVWRRWAPALRRPPLWVYLPLGGLVGFLSIFVGATGPLIAPFFLRDDLDKEQIIGTKAACQLVLHLSKLGAFLGIGYDYRPHLPLLALMLGATVVGTYLGKFLLSRLPTRIFVRVFELALGLLALHLLVGDPLRRLLDGGTP